MLPGLKLDLLLAQAEANPQGDRPPPADPLAFLKQLLVPLGIMFLIFWLLVFRPEKNKRKERERMIANVKKGDTVVTASGVIGKVWRVDEGEVTIVIDKDKDVKARFLKSAIAEVQPADAAA